MTATLKYNDYIKKMTQKRSRAQWLQLLTAKLDQALTDEEEGALTRQNLFENLLHLFIGTYKNAVSGTSASIAGA